MNAFLNGMKNATNLTYTENGALTRRSTNSDLLDLFAMGGAYRKRSDEDCILLFKNAYIENPTYALKCLFYLRDIRGNGQGERRFFRVCMKWLGSYDREAARRNLKYVAEYGRWDDLFVFMGTTLEKDVLALMRAQLAEDVQTQTPSLLAKWLPSINTSSFETRQLANKVRNYFGMTPREYRKTLSILRQRINVLERLMSAGKWDEIEFDKIPSRAGMLYKKAFMRHDLERQEVKGVRTYEEFIKDDTTKVNAKTLYPYEVVAEALKLFRTGSYWSMKELPSMDSVERLAVNKYWDNLQNYFKNASLNAMAVVDTSGSMVGSEPSAPINVAISLGLYCAEKAKGPFAGHYVSFASRPQLIKTEGVDFCDKVQRIYRTNLVDNTNIEATFDLFLDMVVRGECRAEDLPEKLLVISDQEFDSARGYYGRGQDSRTLMENIQKKWAAYGIKMPSLVFWNVQARQNNIPMKVQDGIMFVSGFSPSIFAQIMANKDAVSLMMDVLDSERYAAIK